jgi:hypothetical protein
VIIVGLEKMCKIMASQAQAFGSRGPASPTPQKGCGLPIQKHSPVGDSVMKNYGKRERNHHPTSKRSDLTVLFQVPNIST